MSGQSSEQQLVDDQVDDWTTSFRALLDHGSKCATCASSAAGCGVHRALWRTSRDLLRQSLISR
ncbi:hypothetical protein ACIQ8D_15210 [Streptomyces sp. NPDC096094]|uniref:hypothetical protein n=1 Tax=Streptomyces sp. NPDC096094 TaxID=3366073 RepID=UPI0038158D46